MRRLFKYLFRMLFLVALGFAAYAMFAKLPAPTHESTVKLSLPATLTQGQGQGQGQGQAPASK